jgi:hypothetical protein
MASTPRVGAQRLGRLDHPADSVAHALYDRSKFLMHPSVAVKAVISARAQAVVSTATVRPLLLAEGPNDLSIRSIPPYLAQGLYLQHLKPLRGATERFLRRGTAILIAQHVSDLSLPDAAVALGYAPKTPHTVLPRLGYDLSALESQHAFHVAVGRIYAAIQAGPRLDFRQRREALLNWRLSVSAAACLREGARRNGNQRDDFDDRWATAATLWIWAFVTEADPITHPLVARSRAEGLSDKNLRPMPQLRGLRSRASPATTTKVENYAASASLAIDAGRPPPPLQVL